MTSEVRLHPDTGTLERYSLGHLTDGELERVEEHLFVCEFCQDELTQVDSFVGDLKEALGNFQQKPKWDPFGFLRPLFVFPGPMLASACAAVALLMVVPLTRQPQQPSLQVPQIVRMQTERGVGTGRAGVHRPLHLQLVSNAAREGSLHVEIADSNGAIIWKGAASRNGTVDVDAPALKAGEYWVRLFCDTNFRNEYHLEVE